MVFRLVVGCDRRWWVEGRQDGVWHRRLLPSKRSIQQQWYPEVRRNFWNMRIEHKCLSRWGCLGRSLGELSSGWWGKSHQMLCIGRADVVAQCGIGPGGLELGYQGFLFHRIGGTGFCSRRTPVALFGPCGVARGRRHWLSAVRIDTCR